MFGLGFFEIIIVLLGVIVFIRPSDLPKFVYRVGKIYSQLKETYSKFIREINLMRINVEEMVEKQTDEKEQNKQKKVTKDEMQPLQEVVSQTPKKSKLMTSTKTKKNKLISSKSSLLKKPQKPQKPRKLKKTILPNEIKIKEKKTKKIKKETIKKTIK